MLRARWRTDIRPPAIPPFMPLLAVIGTAALMSLAAAQLAAAAPLFRTSAAADCSSPGAAARAAGRHSGFPPAVVQKIDARGEFTGRIVTLPGRGAIDLPAESSVSQPVGDALVYSTSVGGHSEIHLVDLGSGCDAVVARPVGVARSATLDPAASAIYVHGVAFPARTDMGVTRYALDGSAAQQVVPPLPDDARFGLTFGTKLGWSTGGGTLFVQSCAIAACRTRLLDTASGSITTFDSADQGPIVGVSAAHLITYGACDGLPCSLLSSDLGSGSTATLVEEAWSATLIPGPDGSGVVRVETAAGIVEVAQ